MLRRLILTLIVSLIAVTCSSFSPDSHTSPRVLVLLDDFGIKSSHSLYFKALENRGYNLEFKLARDPKIALQRYGQYLYEALILFSPSVDRFGGNVDAAAILNFVDSGRDLILAADVFASDLIREIATECGVDFDEDPAASVIDHKSYAFSDTDGDHTLIAASNFIQSEVILGSKTIEVPVLFQGIAHSVNPTNGLVLKVLSASPAAYSANPGSKLSNPPTLTGSAISLVSVVQARNNARILIAGSLSMFSNRFLRSGVQKAGNPTRHDKSGNEQFLTEISKWVFHERGHLKAINVRHHNVGQADEPSMYRISDDTEFSVEIYEWSGTSWEPYVADDVQVQFYMMSPYVLKTLSTNQQGLYHTSFKVPDVYGVFQFKVEYERLGYTSLSLSKQQQSVHAILDAIFTMGHPETVSLCFSTGIPVRPFRHNEYERFLTAAFPYYGASFSMMAGFFVFSLAYLYNK